jgi:hypothetical protein
VVLKEISLAVAFSGALTPGNQLHGEIDQESVGESFEFEFAGLLGVRVVGLDAVGPEADQRRREASDQRVGGILVCVEMSGREVAVDRAIGGEKGSRADERPISSSMV